MHLIILMRLMHLILSALKGNPCITRHDKLFYSFYFASFKASRSKIILNHLSETNQATPPTKKKSQHIDHVPRYYFKTFSKDQGTWLLLLLLLLSYYYTTINTIKLSVAAYFITLLFNNLPFCCDDPCMS